jgi:bidirectional [NiFe] hydrogenase diaphorase subunit
MTQNLKQIDPPSDDKRWRIVQATMRRNGFKRSGLIETLHSVQESFGFLDEESLRYVSFSLRAPLSQVYGVSTFYHLFSLKPAGKHSCVVCTGTACYIKGAPQLLARIQETYGIKPGETTEDGRFSLLTARCVGSCGLAPVAVFDSEVQGNQSAEKTLTIMQAWESSDE